MTLGDSLDVDVRPGATAREVVAASGGLGYPLARAFCGPVALDPDHPAGVWPLVAGARVLDRPQRPREPTTGEVLRVVAGPDAGHVAGLSSAVVLGRGDGCDIVLADPSVSRSHATVRDGRVRAHRSAINRVRRVRGLSTRTVWRSLPVEPGDVLVLGRSAVRIEIAGRAVPGEESETRAEGGSAGPRVAHPEPRWGAASGSLVGGVALAAATGRWWLLAVGALYPIAALVPRLWRAVRARRDPAPAMVGPLADCRWAVGARSIAVCGDDPRGFARAILLGLGGRARTGPWREPWMRWLPEPQESTPEIVLASPGLAPSWCDVVVETAPAGATIAAATGAWTSPTCEVSAATAERAARALAGRAEPGGIPASVRTADIASARGSRGLDASAVAAAIGVSESGPVVVDLDRDGPHLLVAGTTGAGKSALLETLVLSLAQRTSPERLAIALIDFKGGAGLRACASLPHIVGTLSDLDGRLARRALASLAAEIRERKEGSDAAGVPDIAAWERAGGAPPRLVVVIDEYQEVAASYREVVPDIARLAAQGRSLGVHLVLSTQRPAGAVTPDIRANVGTSIALRTESDSDSRDVIGVGAAAEIPRGLPGRAIMLTGSTRTEFQVALAHPEPSPPVRRWGTSDAASDPIALAHSVAERWDGAARPRRLWRAPVRALRPDDAPPSSGTSRPAVWIGRADDPSAREQPEVWWEPGAGPLAILGPAGRERDEVVAGVCMLAERAGLDVVILPDDPREAARTVAIVAATGALLVIPDVPRALIALGTVDTGRGAEALSDLASGRAPLVLACPASPASRLVAHASTRVLLGGADPAEAASWGVPREAAALPAGGGLASVSVAGRWLEARLARAEPTEATRVVATLPDGVAPPPAASDPGAVGVGWSGDRALPLVLDSATPVIVVGPPTAERERVVALLDGARGASGESLAVTAVDHPAAIPARDRASATVVVSEPSYRTVRELLGTDALGLADASPRRGRVVIVRAGLAEAAQLASIPSAGAPAD